MTFKVGDLVKFNRWAASGAKEYGLDPSVHRLVRDVYFSMAACGQIVAVDGSELRWYAHALEFATPAPERIAAEKDKAIFEKIGQRIADCLTKPTIIPEKPSVSSAIDAIHSSRKAMPNRWPEVDA